MMHIITIGRIAADGRTVLERDVILHESDIEALTGTNDMDEAALCCCDKDLDEWVVDIKEAGRYIYINYPEKKDGTLEIYGEISFTA